MSSRGQLGAEILASFVSDVGHWVAQAVGVEGAFVAAYCGVEYPIDTQTESAQLDA